MITRGMTPYETLSHIRDYEEWIRCRINGLFKKYKKKLMNKFVPEDTILGTSNYTIEGDRCMMKAIKCYYGKVANFYWCVLIITDRGYIIPISDAVTNKAIAFFTITKHAEQRMKERLGMDIYTFFDEAYIKKNHTAHHLEKYDYNNNPDEYVCQMGDAFLIIQKNGFELIVKTVLDKNELYTPQMQNYYDSKVRREEYDGKVRIAQKAQELAYNKALKIKNTQDLYRWLG